MLKYMVWLAMLRRNFVHLGDSGMNWIFPKWEGLWFFMFPLWMLYLNVCHLIFNPTLTFMKYPSINFMSEKKLWLCDAWGRAQSLKLRHLLYHLRFLTACLQIYLGFHIRIPWIRKHRTNGNLFLTTMGAEFVGSRQKSHDVWWRSTS